jgi:hypothetical protein
VAFERSAYTVTKGEITKFNSSPRSAPQKIFESDQVRTRLTAGGSRIRTPGPCYRFKKNQAVFVYRKDGVVNIKDALSFLKDWVTSLIQLETGVLAVFGLAAGFSQVFIQSASTSGVGAAATVPAWVPWVLGIQLLLIFFSGFSILSSMYYGLMLLAALPGAVQRVPESTAARQSMVISSSALAFQCTSRRP